MTTTLIIAGITAALMVLSVLLKPYIYVKKLKIGLYWIICAAGAAAMLLSGRLSVADAWSGITAPTAVNPLKILALFISMTLISVFLGDAGFFDVCADKVFRSAGGSQFKLFLTLYAVVAVLTVFTSNDIIVLTFTPPICMFAAKAKVSPLPYLVGEFVAANTWSMMLIVGNPTNIYLAGSAGITFAEYFSVMWLPAIGGGVASLAAMLLVFGKKLREPLCGGESAGNKTVTFRKIPLIVALIHLIVCIVMLAVSYYIGVEMWIICVVLAASLMAFNLIYDLVIQKSVRPVMQSVKKAPYELIPFVLSMFVIVLALSECGFTSLAANCLSSGKKIDGATFSFLSALTSNALNNIPAAVLFEKITAGGNLAAVYGAVIGSNVGAYITPVGALAGIMWTNILGEYRVKMNFIKFTSVGLAAAIPTLLVASLMLLIVL